MPRSLVLSVVVLGLLCASLAAAADSFAFPAPQFDGERKVVELPAAYESFCAAGGGRYLIFRPKGARKLDLFDISKLAIVRSIDLPSDDALFAGGLDKLLIVLPTQKAIQRYNLETGEREKMALWPGDVPPAKLAMGYCGHGPLFIWGQGKLVLWDIEEMKPLQPTGPAIEVDQRAKYELRAAANGRAFSYWRTGYMPENFRMLWLNGKAMTTEKTPDGFSFNGSWGMFNADASLLLTSDGTFYNAALRKTSSETLKKTILLPTEDPRYFVSLRNNRDRKQSNEATIYAAAGCQSLVNVKDVESMCSDTLYTHWALCDGQPRLRFLPFAKLLLTLPDKNNQVVVRRLDLQVELAKSGDDHLYVVSLPPASAAPGSAVSYQIETLSKSAVNKYKLEQGPKGLTLSETGLVQWKPTPQDAGDVASVLISVGNGGGKEALHSFDLVVSKPAAPAAGHTASTGTGKTPPPRRPETARPDPVRPDPPKREPRRPGSQEPAEAPGQTLDIVGIGSGTMLGDGVTLVVAIPTQAKLVYVDTAAMRETKRVDLDFKPGAMAVQSGTLFVAVEGAAEVHALDAATGKDKAAIEVPGGAIQQIACHAERGLLYTSSANLEVYAIDPARTTATLTGAQGHFLAVDPRGMFVYTGIQPKSREELKVIQGRDGSMRFVWDDWGSRASMCKYEVQGPKLRLAAQCNNAAVNACRMALSPDGETIGMVGGGGWRPEAPQQGGGYDIVMFRTKDMTSMAGKVTVGAYPNNVAFHPVLKMGAAFQQHGDQRVLFFNSKSFVEKQAVKLGKAPQPTAVMTFGNRGRSLLCASDKGLISIALELSPEDEALLKSSAGKPAASPAATSSTEQPLRSWSDASGKYRIDARFGGLSEGKVILLKEDGTRSMVPLDRLGPADQQYVRGLKM